jgi:2-keto-4-pentenoate hydratase/2-oxohepta-3-ene-1,7-dioic acid hydratase in catechol pathway
MRIATFRLNGQREVGLVSADGKSVTPLAFTAAQALTGAQAVIDLLDAGQALPAAAGQAVPTRDVHLEAPLPLPRRNLWCVGRNYHAHARCRMSSATRW